MPCANHKISVRMGGTLDCRVAVFRVDAEAQLARVLTCPEPDVLASPPHTQARPGHPGGAHMNFRMFTSRGSGSFNRLTPPSWGYSMSMMTYTIEERTAAMMIR